MVKRFESFRLNSAGRNSRGRRRFAGYLVKPILDALRLQAENDAAMIHALLKIDASGIR